MSWMYKLQHATMWWKKHILKGKMFLIRHSTTCALYKHGIWTYSQGIPNEQRGCSRLFLTSSPTYQIVYAHIVLIHVLSKIGWSCSFLYSKTELLFEHLTTHWVNQYCVLFHSIISYSFIHQLYYIPFLYVHIICILPTDTELWNATKCFV